MFGIVKYSPENPSVPTVKKSHKGLIILSVVLLIVCVIALLLMSMFGVFKAKNLGVIYSDKDLNSAIKKVGISVYDSDTGKKVGLEEGGEVISQGKYKLASAKYEERIFKLSDKEATAYINEVLPISKATENVQVKVLDDGEIAISGTLLVDEAVNDFFPQYKNKVPSYAPSKVNFYTQGDVSINDNELSLNLSKFKTGSFELISADKINENADNLESLYKSIPGLEIHSLKTTSDGQIAIDATVPVKATVDKK